MELPEAVELARNFSVMVRIQGPDPKGVKMRKHAFHHYNSGVTTLSASGLLLPHSFKEIPISYSSASALVVTVASVVEPFLSQKHRQNFTPLDLPELIPGAQIDVMVEVDVPASSLALQSLMTHGSWEIGWSLGSLNNVPHTSMDATQTQVGRHLESILESPSRTAMSNTRIAFLGLSSMKSKDLPDMNISRPSKRGDLLLVLGSPFGVLSPVHFLNRKCHTESRSLCGCEAVGILNFLGMEGAPVFGEGTHLIGILNKPLRQRAGGAEIQLVIPWEAIKNAHRELLQKELLSFDYSDPNRPLASPVEKAMRSIVLITVNEGTWASGVLLNENGLILTNAHLFEPWRFGRATVKDEGYGIEDQDDIQDKLGLINRNNNRIRVRLDHMKHPVWVDAGVVYVSKGPLDVALLQLQPIPSRLVAVVPDLGCPPPGSKAYVIGHGLFGPRCDLYPSTNVGVVASVVKMQRPLHATKPGVKETRLTKNLPAMLQTTAAVHPGGSGGTVVNSDGHMIGLVTSNARHGGGTVIPHLNFSIPCEALLPIFKFSQDMQDLSILQDLDRPNEQLSSVWALMPPLSPRPMPQFLQPPQTPLEEETNKEMKGSRFAKFIAERKGDLFSKPNQTIKVKTSLSDMLSSKL
ncbi:hypothetical protein GIB67_037895 [Kingdonia uniflora]|uniref:Glyoxysomal processing protease, glyoxysomal n=1 Tax=Kingdonia uniflora TaxID=39325 RepID=A0A7J7LH17_9MAGN|nr:hypothetical protein GIB67_037895 [Kingdonia uniflora]